MRYSGEPYTTCKTPVLIGTYILTPYGTENRRLKKEVLKWKSILAISQTMRSSFLSRPCGWEWTAWFTELSVRNRRIGIFVLNVPVYGFTRIGLRSFRLIMYIGAVFYASHPTSAEPWVNRSPTPRMGQTRTSRIKYVFKDRFGQMKRAQVILKTMTNLCLGIKKNQEAII